MPGLDGTGDLFRPLLGVVPAHLKTRVVRYSVDQPLSYSDLLLFLEEQLRTEREAVLVAESFSGPLALRYAAAHPERVRAVVLCASFVCSPLPRWLRYLVTPLLFHIPPPNLAIRRFMVGRNAPDSLVQEVKAAVRRVRPQVLARRLRDVFEVECSDALRRCPAPVLYLAAGGDALVRPSSAESVRAAKPDVTVESLEGPHLLLQSRPAEAWQKIEQFLRRTGTFGDSGGSE